MNLVCIPYHDWRKINEEGARTRDAHFINHFSTSEKVSNLVIINRPISILELFVKKKAARIKGEVLLRNRTFTLYKLSGNVFLIDFIFLDFIEPIVKKKKWFLDSFGEKKVSCFFKECMDFLGFSEYKIFNQNVFASNFIKNNSEICSIFDGWDNFMLFPDNLSIREELEKSYSDLAKYSNYWVTNSPKNIDFFTKKFNVLNLELVKNGVDFEKFRKAYTCPNDLIEISSPRIGFGGKITHLFDFELFNYCLDKHSDKNFIIVGQVLSKEVFDKINKSSNFYYLGDKNYADYPAYVCNFDIGIIPYVNNHLDSGADTIKAYEFLAAGLKTVGTFGAGMNDKAEYMYLAKDKEEFSLYIQQALDNEYAHIQLSPENSWESKVNQVLILLNSLK